MVVSLIELGYTIVDHDKVVRPDGKEMTYQEAFAAEAEVMRIMATLPNPHTQPDAMQCIDDSGGYTA